MDNEHVISLPGVAFTRGVQSLNPGRRTRGAVLLGFDCEYDSGTQDIICYQLSDGEHSVLMEAWEDLTWRGLSEWVLQTLRSWGYATRYISTVVLVSHFSTAELSHIKDFWHGATVRRVSPQQVYNATYRIDRRTRLVVMDQYHFFNTSLANVAETFGERKLTYDTRSVTREALQDPVFREYALWDAVVCPRIFNTFRERVWDDHEIDVLNYPTPASIAMAVYRAHWLHSSLDPPETPIRRQAWRSLWGGRAEAYVHGDFYGAYTLRDVKSLYPTSTLLLDILPTARDWVRRAHPTGADGLCTIDFSFPDDTLFPCLPVFHKDRLYFPLRGQSDCTLAEARLAESLGARVRYRRIYEYETGDASLSRFMTHWMEEKDRCEAAGDEVGRTLAKLFMNALIGKFSQHRGDVDIEDLKTFAQQIDVPLETACKPTFVHPDKPKAAPRIGGNIMPEWSALILGKARAVMGSLLAQVQAQAPDPRFPGSLICSTDSMLVPDSLNKAVDEAMRRENVLLTSKNIKGRTTHRVRVVRNRAYAAETEAGDIVFGAAHAVHMAQRDALPFILSDSQTYTKRRRAGLKTAIQKGVRFFDTTNEQMTFARRWDEKRRLCGTGSVPWRDVDEYDRHQAQKAINAPTASLPSGQAGGALRSLSRDPRR